MSFRVIFAFFVCLYIVISILFFNLYSSIAMKDAKQQATYILNNMLEIRAYINKHQRPQILEELNDLGKSHVDISLLSANVMIDNIYTGNLIKNKIPFEYKLSSISPLNPKHKASKFEEEILNGFRDDITKREYTDIIYEDGDAYLFMAKPIERNTHSCLQCHGSPETSPKKLTDRYGITSGFNYEINDLNAMLYVKIPVVSILKNHTEEFYWGGLAMLLAFAVILVLIYIVYQKDKKIQINNESLFHHQNRLALMGNMIGNISHQLKQPLTHLSNIFINLELQIEMKKLTSEKVQDKINDANEQIRFMSGTIDDFRNFFLPKDVLEPIYIYEIINKTKSLLSASLTNNYIKMEIDVQENFLINAQKNEVIQIFMNIMGNAKDAFILNEVTSREVYVKAYRKKNYGFVTIENNGGNIDEAIIGNIFDAYFTTKKLTNGTGIGLHMSRGIIEAYKGSITAKNTKNGVMFILKFPISK